MLKLNFSYTGQTLLRDWWKQVKAHFSEVENYVNSLETNIENSITSESNERKNADTALSDSLKAEAASRSAADERLRNKTEELDQAIKQETNSRKSTDSWLETRIGNEAAARQNEDLLIKKSVSELSESAHTHENLSALAEISADDVAGWREKADYEGKQIERMEYLEEVCRSLLLAVHSLYGASGVSLFDGGVDGEIITEPSLDGGGFEEDNSYEEFDCGTFETDIFAAVAVIDGGNY